MLSVPRDMSDGGDRDDALCGACGELISDIIFPECEHCGQDLHDPDDCPDVWQPHVLYKFCNKGCAAKFLRLNAQRVAFPLVQRLQSAPAGASPCPAEHPHEDI